MSFNLNEMVRVNHIIPETYARLPKDPRLRIGGNILLYYPEE